MLSPFPFLRLITLAGFISVFRVGFDMRFVNPRTVVGIHYFHGFFHTLGEMPPSEPQETVCREPSGRVLMESVIAGRLHSDNYHFNSGLPPERGPLVNNMDSKPENALSCQANAMDAFSAMDLMDDDP